MTAAALSTTHMTRKAQSQKERRGHRRVHDAVALQLQRIRDLPAAGEPRPARPAAPEFRRANKYDIEGYAEVKRHHPAVAAYVDELEERIRQLLIDTDRTPEMPTHKVSLSASGMALADDIHLVPGEWVSVSMVLFPSMDRIACDAQVVSAGDAPEIANGDKPTYRLMFVRMTDADRAVLACHVDSLLGTLPQHDE